MRVHTLLPVHAAPPPGMHPRAAHEEKSLMQNQVNTRYWRLLVDRLCPDRAVLSSLVLLVLVGHAVL